MIFCQVSYFGSCSLEGTSFESKTQKPAWFCCSRLFVNWMSHKINHKTVSFEFQKEHFEHVRIISERISSCFHIVLSCFHIVLHIFPWLWRSLKLCSPARTTNPCTTTAAATRRACRSWPSARPLGPRESSPWCTWSRGSPCGMAEFSLPAAKIMGQKTKKR